jgi:acid phosphatase type 7
VGWRFDTLLSSAPLEKVSGTRRIESGHLTVMRTRTTKYLASVLLACAAAVLVAVPVFGRPMTVALVGAGDIAHCTSANDEATARLLGSTLRGSTQDGALPSLRQARVITMGDNVQGSGLPSEFANCYDNYRISDGRTYDRSRPAWWGQYKSRTMPALGNHEYYNSSALRLRSKPYLDYFKAKNGFKLPRSPVPNTKASPGLKLGEGYYSYNLGSWHIVALNSNDHCAYVRCSGKSAQARWLRRDLAANPRACTLAYIHHPLYATGTGGVAPRIKPLWRILYNHGAEVILNGHNHRYERLARIDPDGNPDPARGIRSITAGTGGVPGGGTTATPPPSSQVRIFGTSGVIKMTLRGGSYSWAFVAADGTRNGAVMDSGTESCH